MRLSCLACWKSLLQSKRHANFAVRQFAGGAPHREQCPLARTRVRPARVERIKL